MAAAIRGKPKSEAHREKLRAANLGVKRGPHSLETRAKIGDGNRGKTVSDDTRAKLRSKRHTEATREKLRQLAVGRKMSATAKQRMSEAGKARWARERAV